MEDGINETRDTVNQLADQFQRKAYIRKCGICGKTGYSKGSCPNRPIAQFNFTWSYFTPLKPIVPQCMPSDSDGDDDNIGDYDKADNEWYYALEKKTVTSK